jgi:hypothetical protein
MGSSLEAGGALLSFLKDFHGLSILVGTCQTNLALAKLPWQGLRSQFLSIKVSLLAEVVAGTSNCLLTTFTKVAMLTNKDEKKG